MFLVSTSFGYTTTFIKTLKFIAIEARFFTSSVLLNPKSMIGRTRGYPFFFMISSADHELLNAYKNKNIRQSGFFQAQRSLECCFSSS